MSTSAFTTAKTNHTRLRSRRIGALLVGIAPSRYSRVSNQRPFSHLLFAIAQVVGPALAVQVRGAGVQGVPRKCAITGPRRVPAEHCIQ